MFALVGLHIENRMHEMPAALLLQWTISPGIVEQGGFSGFPFKIRVTVHSELTQGFAAIMHCRVVVAVEDLRVCFYNLPRVWSFPTVRISCMCDIMYIYTSLDVKSMCVDFGSS